MKRVNTHIGTAPIPRLARLGFACVMAVSLVAGGLALAGPAGAQTHNAPKAEKYTPTIWVDPDGCEHWVMDDGWRGYMDIRLDRDGRPICNRGNICAVMSGDHLFATGSAGIGAEGRRKLESFFRSAGAPGYIIVGHTDSRGSAAANQSLSERRAQEVARVGRAAGAKIVSVSGRGAAQPKASNATGVGRSANRRVEIFCLGGKGSK